ncbi:futalosine hydrolase [Alkalihalobacterium chitinilyticum]|uniref:Futalosine hydrolase n=1 Tax=Alkalihalobacterium chitinilyticum TaxID=2980103 RepID=A0ABT5VG84_9BACI|nr:futalosine hydrolase [Alkalihalobacterium chitinilyticum]MDE5414444.1 futalosine hydrolase [Alkalihalobacterium chitinilyticum]
MNQNTTNENQHKEKINNRKILIITSVEAEKEAILRGLKPTNSIDVVVSGVGIAAAATATARVLATKTYDLVINAGIAGGFVGQAEVGSIVIANEIVAADFGTETPEGFASIDELGFGSSRMKADENLVEVVSKTFRNAGQTVTTGPIITVSTVTGTAETTEEMLRRVPSVKAEAMEGFGVATAAGQFGIPILEIRTISNAVGPRDRDAWRIKEALQTLQEASTILQEVLT